MPGLTVSQIITNVIAFVDVIVFIAVLFTIKKVMKCCPPYEKTKVNCKLFFSIIAAFLLYRLSWFFIDYFSLGETFYESIVIANFFLMLAGILLYYTIGKLFEKTKKGVVDAF